MCDFVETLLKVAIYFAPTLSFDGSEKGVQIEILKDNHKPPTVIGSVTATLYDARPVIHPTAKKHTEEAPLMAKSPGKLI